jgi:predicted exporter
VRNLAGRYLAQSVSMRSAIMLLLLSLVVVLAGWHRGDTLDDVRRFQAPSPVLAREEARLRSLVGFAPSSGFLLVRGASRDEATAREEAMLAELDAAGEADAVLWAASRLDPTSAMMARDADLIESRLIEPELAQFVKTLGGGNEDAYAGVARKAETDQGTPPGFVSALRGQTGDVYWSIAPVSDEISHVPDMPGVELVEPAGRYSDLLGQYRWLASLGLAGAVAATGLMLFAYYRSLSSLRILLPTTVALAVTPAVMVLAGIPFSFFTAMGLFLVAGAGVDYAIFQWEKPGAEGVWTRVGIVLAASMTCISVGLLGLSSVLPVRSFGLTVAIGVVISLLFSPLVRGWSGGKIPGGGS